MASRPSQAKRRIGFRDRWKEKFSPSGSKSNTVNSAPPANACSDQSQVLSSDQNSGDISRSVSNDIQPAGVALTTGDSHTQPEVRPIREVWNEAYEDLRAEDEDLITKYEARLRESVYGAIASTSSPVVGSVGRQELMKSVVDKRLEQYKEDAWKVKALGEEFLVKDMAKPVVGIIKWADKYIGDALKSNPMASFGWAAVMVFMPLILNPSDQEAALLKGLVSVSNVLVRSTMQENLYFRRWEANADKNDSLDFLPSHKGYRDTLKALYVLVLKYQATSVSYFTKNGSLRILADMVKWHKWEDLLKAIEVQDGAMCRTYDLLSDVKIEEEFEKLDKRHAETVEILKSGFNDLSGLRKAIEAAQKDSGRSALLDWLSSVDPSLNYNNARGKYDQGGHGTGDWLIRNNKDFEKWKIAPNSLMWLNGKAGSGKSVLSSSVITHLRETHGKNPQTALAYFYFSFNDEKKQTTVGMLESIIKQICCCRPDTPLSVKALEDLKARGHRPDIETLQKVLLETLKGFSRVYVIVDALDECSDMEDGRDRLLRCLNAIQQKEPANLHMFLTSRREKDIETSYRAIESASEKWDINLEAYKPAIDHDIGLLIDSTLSSLSYNSWPNELKEVAKKELIEKSDGMFQYIACQFEALRPLKSLAKIKKALKDLPQGLDATYDRMLARINSEDQKQVARVLKWLSYSLRPLLLEEIAEIFILDPSADVPFDDENRLLTPSAVLDYLSGFATETRVSLSKYHTDHYVRRGTEAVEIRLAHFSIKEYLVSSRISSDRSSTFRIEETAAHIDIVESCLAYHLHLSHNILATEKMVNQYQLWEYVVNFWPKHLDMVPELKQTAAIKTGALLIFTRGSRSLLNMSRIRDPDDGRHEPRWKTTAETLGLPLYHACSIGALQLAGLVIAADKGSTIDEISPTCKYRTALLAVASRGHESVVQLLLDRGADVNAQGGNYGNALQAAAFQGESNIVQFLLERGVDVNAQGGYFGNSLQAAACEGESSIVQLLLDRGADINAQGGYYGNALQAAAYRGYESVVQLLLDRGAKVNAQGGEYGNALQAAARRGHESVVQLLLDRGADVNTQGGYFGNALQAAALEGDNNLVQLLLDRGANVNAQGGEYGNALQAAIAEENWEPAELLLSEGAKLDRPGPEWEELLARVGEAWGTTKKNMLQNFQNNPTMEGLAMMREEQRKTRKKAALEEEERREKRKAEKLKNGSQESDTESSLWDGILRDASTSSSTEDEEDDDDQDEEH
ncbi:hypothetical protein BKA65DRAFT_242529 [Rhexocercosporidium sp. MPI-PUGE-AT-0058]|nr:hypothetical protein BKA65DRAFT_242529 [Rhexocercosporidium sp. MPI-PUGE-AT-0058]